MFCPQTYVGSVGSPKFQEGTLKGAWPTGSVAEPEASPVCSWELASRKHTPLLFHARAFLLGAGQERGDLCHPILTEPGGESVRFWGFKSLLLQHKQAVFFGTIFIHNKMVCWSYPPLFPLPFGLELRWRGKGCNLLESLPILSTDMRPLTAN